MSLISSKIEKVRALELPLGVRADGDTIAGPYLALVKWQSLWTDKLHQVYINGSYAGSTIDTQQRQLLIRIPACFQTPARIEVFAVEPGDGDTDFGGELDKSLTRSGRVKITFLREQSLPIGATAQIYFDNATGQIDYDNPVNDNPIRIWTDWQDKCGFGLSCFGKSDFGYDASAAVGFGRGSFANGQFGIDADTFEWISESLSAGVYKFAAKIFDKKGDLSTAAETRQVTVTPAARPAEKLSVSAFDKQTNQLILTIT